MLCPWLLLVHAAASKTHQEDRSYVGLGFSHDGMTPPIRSSCEGLPLDSTDRNFSVAERLCCCCDFLFEIAGVGRDGAFSSGGRCRPVLQLCTSGDFLTLDENWLTREHEDHDELALRRERHLFQIEALEMQRGRGSINVKRRGTKCSRKVESSTVGVSRVFSFSYGHRSGCGDLRALGRCGVVPKVEVSTLSICTVLGRGRAGKQRTRRRMPTVFLVDGHL